MDDSRDDGEPQTTAPQRTRCSSQAAFKKSRPSTAPNDRRLTPQEFNAARRSADPCDLDAFVKGYVTTVPVALDALYAIGRTGTRAWASRALANPLIAMTQELLRMEHWDFHLLRRYTRRLIRGTVKPWEIILLWCAEQAGVNPEFVSDTISLLARKDFRASMEGRWVKVSWSERLELIRNRLSEVMLQPLLEVTGGMVLFDPESPCTDAGSESYTVYSRAGCWLGGNGSSSAFFSRCDAEEWLERAMIDEPEFMAAYLALIVENRDVPDRIRFKMISHIDFVPKEEIQGWADRLAGRFTPVPGGLTMTAIENLERGRSRAPLQLYGPVMAALQGYIPDGEMVSNHERFFNVSENMW